MSLRDDLMQTAQAAAAATPPPALEAMARGQRELERLGLVDRCPKVGDPAPDFTLPNAAGMPVHLQHLRRQGPVIVTFFRGSWCPFCNLTLRALQQALPDFRALGARLVAISPQLAAHNDALAAQHHLGFDLLSDAGNVVGSRYNVVYTLPNFLRTLFVSAGADLEAYNGDGTFTLPLAATFIVASDGRIHYAFADVNPAQRAEPSDLCQVLATLARDVSPAG